MQSGRDWRIKNALLVDLKVHIALGSASALGKPTRKMDCEVQKVCCEEGRSPMANHDPDDLGMMTMKEVCVSYVRRTTEVGENVQEEQIVHLVALMHWQKT